MNKTTNNLFAAAIIIGGLVLLAACAGPPREEMQKAGEAVNAAENDKDAVTYAGNTLVSAREALDRMREEAALKHYDRAKTSAAEAVKAADRAIAEGQAGALRARETASPQLNSLVPAISEAETIIAEAQEVPDTNLDTAALKQELDAVQQIAQEAQDSFNNNKYEEALDKVQTAATEIGNITGKVSGAVQAASRKK
ncbi:MAG: hypothetical protein LBQ88_07415 [Treponema sp.]|nr:hypothetical protein [Treponema sp.]